MQNEEKVRIALFAITKRNFYKIVQLGNSNKKLTEILRG